jgi:hypothetical protein
MLIIHHGYFNYHQTKAGGVYGNKWPVTNPLRFPAPVCSNFDHKSLEEREFQTSQPAPTGRFAAL